MALPPELLVVGGGLVVLGVKAIEGGVNHLMDYADQIKSDPVDTDEELMWKLITYPHDPRELMVYHQLSKEKQKEVTDERKARKKEKAAQLIQERVRLFLARLENEELENELARLASYIRVLEKQTITVSGQVVRDLHMVVDDTTIKQLIESLENEPYKQSLTGEARNAIGDGWFSSNLIIQIDVTWDGHRTEREQLGDLVTLSEIVNELKTNIIYVSYA